MVGTAFGGAWQEGMEVVNENLVELPAPDAEELEFIGSVPAGVEINTWGDARWEVSENNFGSTMLDTKAITVPTSTQSLLPADRTNIALEPDTTYQVRLKYTSTDPALESEYSDVVTFKTAAEQDGWVDVTANGKYQDVAYGDGVFVAIGNDNNSALDALARSEDGINWTFPAPAVEGVNWNGVAYGAGKFIAVAGSTTGKDTRIMSSPDGNTWTEVADPDVMNYNQVTYANNKFVAVGNGSSKSGVSNLQRMSYSADGLSWNYATTPSNNNWMDVAYGAGKFVSVGADAAVYSVDGETWQAIPSFPAGRWYAICFGDNKFVATGMKVVAYSTDGMSWTTTTPAEELSYYTVTYGKDKYVALASSGTNRIMHSFDGIDWIASYTSNLKFWTGNTYANRTLCFCCIRQRYQSNHGVTHRYW